MNPVGIINLKATEVKQQLQNVQEINSEVDHLKFGTIMRNLRGGHVSPP